ncbi:hypothetical protein [Pseudomonas paeninsulae]|uniref:hypothetical protein n=1 Tax=Pseudomonas paeninsulae TaxID=3110772 RepID=UPI002D77ACD3|nr:hypothetical protein [Pseudomonas sp. IT1137]
MYAELERRVEERTAQLAEANQRLHAEIAERERAEQAVRQLFLIDELTAGCITAATSCYWPNASCWRHGGVSGEACCCMPIWIT